MISTREALQILQTEWIQLPAAELPLSSALGYFLAENVKALHDVPGFDNSAMDGYAICLDAWDGESAFQVVGEVAAGDVPQQMLKSGEAMRIFTGAMVPAGAQAVVMQEKTLRDGDRVLIQDEAVRPGLNIRYRGTQTMAGDVVLAAGSQILPGTVGFLASIGVNKVKVHAKPRVNIIVTGKEIVAPGSALQPGQVFECNSYSLSAALKSAGIEAHIQICGDDESEIAAAISAALHQSDLLLVTGGISVGDYDFVLPALEKNGVEKRFYKVKQKPAKPLYFGKKNQTLVFGLPGNPASVLTAFYVYVWPCLRAMCGASGPFRYEENRLMQPVQKKPGLTHFMKGFSHAGRVELLQGQESYRMDAFAQANCLVVWDEASDGEKEGSFVQIIPFAW